MASGTVHAVNVSDGGVPKRIIQSAMIRHGGLEGDRQEDLRHHGGPDRAVTLYSLELIKSLQQEGHPIVPGSIGENITVEGLDWSLLSAGVRIKVGHATLELTRGATPCWKIGPSFLNDNFDRIAEKLHPGWDRWCARVVHEGVVAVGDPVELIPRS
jgi:MOSC domain-containing protein YiiM